MTYYVSSGTLNPTHSLWLAGSVGSLVSASNRSFVWFMERFMSDAVRTQRSVCVGPNVSGEQFCLYAEIKKTTVAWPSNSPDFKPVDYSAWKYETRCTKCTVDLEDLGYRVDAEGTKLGHADRHCDSQSLLMVLVVSACRYDILNTV